MRFQRAYLYFASLISLLALALGLASLASEVIYLWFAPDRPPTGPVALLTHPQVLPWLVWSVVAAFLWGAHWFLANRVARTLTMAGASERNAPIRKAYLYLGQLALLLFLGAEAMLMLYNLLLALLGQPAADLSPWPARVLAPAACTAINLALWIYLRRVTVSDGDFGHEMGSAKGWRRGYYYLGIALATMIAAAGAGEFISTFLRVAGQVYTFGIQPGDPSSWRRLGAASLAATLVAFPAVIALWRGANRIAAEVGDAEINAVSRKLLVYGGRAAGAGVTLVSLGFLAWQILLIVLGQFPSDAQLFWEEQLAPALAYVPVGLIVWISFSTAARSDLAWVEESRESAVLRRIYYYLVAALGLAAFWYGVQALLVLLLLLVLRIWPPSLLLTEQARRFFGLSAVLALVGGPVWWAHWRPQQVLARQEGPVGYEERGSLLRRIYLYAVAAVGALVAVFTLGVVLYQAPGWLFGPGSAGTFVQSVVQLGVAITMALVWWIAHGIVLRGDQRLLAEDQASIETAAALPIAYGNEADGGAAGDRVSGHTPETPGTTGPESPVLPDPVLNPGATTDFPGVPPPLFGEEEAALLAVQSSPQPAPHAATEPPPAAEPTGRGRHFEREALRANLPAPNESQQPASPADAQTDSGSDAPPAGDAPIVIVVDGGDGVLGRDLLAALREAVPQATLWPLAVSQAAREAMAQAMGMETLASVPLDAVSNAAVILGPSDLVAPAGPDGELSSELAAALTASLARKVLLPPRNPRLRWVAAPDWPQERWVGYAVAEVVQALRS